MQLDGLTADQARFAHLLGMPGPEVLDERMRRQLGSIQRWCSSNVRPRYVARLLDIAAIESDRVILRELETLRAGAYFLKQLRQNNASAVVVVAQTLGSTLSSRATRLWEEDRLDESHMLSVYGAALTEATSESIGQQLCAWASTNGYFVLPKQAPGYNDWPTDYLVDLHDLVHQSGQAASLGLKLHQGTSLAPIYSLLAAHGLTRDPRAPHRMTTSHNPCHTCTLPGCTYRRVPFRAAAPMRDASSTLGTVLA